MSRSNYQDGYDMEQWDLIRWRGAVKSAIRGARGQKLLRELLDALDAMPVKELIAESLQEQDGGVCALGSLAQRKGIDVSAINPEDSNCVAKTFGIADALAREIAFENDEVNTRFTPEERWEYMRQWVDSHIYRPANVPGEEGK